MKKINETIAVTLMLLATVGTIIGVFAIEGVRRKKFYTVELIARSPLNGNWYPKEFKVPFGREVKIYIRNVETVSHGFSLPEFNVSAREIKQERWRWYGLPLIKEALFRFSARFGALTSICI